MLGRVAATSSLVVVLCIASVPQGAASLYGRGFGGYPYGGFSGDFGMRQQRPQYSGPWGINTADDAYSYHCPAYQAAAVSRWRETADGGLSATVSLPGVHPNNRRVWVGEDSTNLHVRAARPLSAVGGRRCLPRGAQLSADGRAEVLEVTLDVPPMLVDINRAVLRDVRGGVEILVPRKSAIRDVHEASPPEAHSQRLPANQRGVIGSVPTSAAVPAPARRSTATARSGFLAPAPRPTWLPPPDGIEVEDEDWPEPEKRADAAEGWLDNRGDFHFYGE